MGSRGEFQLCVTPANLGPWGYQGGVGLSALRNAYLPLKKASPFQASGLSFLRKEDSKPARRNRKTGPRLTFASQRKTFPNSTAGSCRAPRSGRSSWSNFILDLGY
jgi:hypothetical protein